MSPLIPIALNLLPGLSKRLAGGKNADTISRVASVVSEVLNTSDPGEAALAAQDPAKAAELRIRLAEIEAEADAQRDQAVIAKMDAQRAADQANQDARFREMKAYMDSQADARDKALKAAESDSIYRFGPLAMSMIVTIGFFVLLYMLIRGTLDGQDTNVLQIINIGFGTLTAGFATVISFWLGSSDSVRQKDGMAVEFQRQRSEETRDILSRQSQQTETIMKQQTVQAQELIRRVEKGSGNGTPSAAPKATAAAKTPRQFSACIAMVLDQESKMAGRADDPRGTTNMGVTRQMLSAWRETDVSEADLAAMQEDEALQVHRNICWNALSCQEMPVGIDLAMLDYAVEFGMRSAAKALQSAVAVEADGQIGPITLGAIAQFQPGELLDHLREIREGLYRNRTGIETLGGLWAARLDTIHRAAEAMLKP